MPAANIYWDINSDSAPTKPFTSVRLATPSRAINPFPQFKILHPKFGLVPVNSLRHNWDFDARL